MQILTSSSILVESYISLGYRFDDTHLLKCSIVIATSYPSFKTLSRSIKEYCRLLRYLKARGQVLSYRGGHVYVVRSESRDWQILGEQAERTCRLLDQILIRNKAFLSSKRRGHYLESGSRSWIPLRDVLHYPQILLDLLTYQNEPDNLLDTSIALDYLRTNFKILHQQAALRVATAAASEKWFLPKKGSNRACGLVV